MISEQTYADSAKMIGCEIAVIKAVASIESQSGGFDEQGRLKILFEPYIFYKALRKAGYDIGRLTLPSANNSDILRSSWDATMYGKYSEQWGKLKKAIKIDEQIALESCSWGMFQIMGFNAKKAGYPSVHIMTNAYSLGENEQLRSFTEYILSTQLDDELRAKDFTSFARQYNGELYWKNQYDVKLLKAYNSFKK